MENTFWMALSTTPLGMLVSYPVISQIDQHTLFQQVRWFMSAPLTSCRGRSRKIRSSVWLPWQAACWSP
ncbi:MAG TPA: hypothetical protein VLR50_13590 [Desulfobacterales bacterium]|nr:hypothetical protein [Desulfobacterales bacterium]